MTVMRRWRLIQSLYDGPPRPSRVGFAEPTRGSIRKNSRIRPWGPGRYQLFAALGAVLLACFPTSPVFATPPKLDHLFPSGGQRGTTVELIATGNFDTWPVEVWADREGLEVTADKAKGKLKCMIADTAVGTYWLRFHNQDGATAQRPFIVGNLPEVVEVEPNDDPRKPQALNQMCIVNGKLEKAGDVDSYAITLSRGEKLVASILANHVLASPMDAVLQICDENGFVLAQNDDAGTLDPHLVFDVPTDGTYLVRTFAFPETANSTINFAGASNFIYRLTVTTGGFVEHCLPMSLQRGKPTRVTLAGWSLPEDAKTITVEGAAGDTRAFANHSLVNAAFELPVLDAAPIVARPDSNVSTPQAVELPCAITGVLSAPAQVDLFSFQASKGQKIDLQVQSRSLGFPLDAVIQISDENGKLIKEVDDASKLYDPQYTLSVMKEGEYRVSIRDLHDRGGKRFVYRLDLAVAEPSYTLAVASDVFSVQPNKEFEIPVTVTRLHGLNADIEITAVNLPAGVTASPVVSQAAGETAKSVKLKLKATDDAISGSFSIIGQIAQQTARTKANFTQATPANRFADLWVHILVVSSTVHR